MSLPPASSGPQSAQSVGSVGAVGAERSVQSDWSDLPVLGVGLGYRPPLHTGILQHAGEIDFLEIIADHYFDAPREKERELEQLRARFPLIPHGLDLSLGSAEGIDAHYLDQLARVVAQVEPPWWSEHLAFTHAGGVSIGHLAPLTWSWKMVDTVARNVEQVRRAIGVPLILENITYAFAMPGAELTEGEFLTAVVERTGCGLLLDVTNLYTNSVNHQFDPAAFLDSIPLEAVVQLHFVGGHWQGEQLVDSHSEPTPQEVLGLLDQVLQRASVKGCLLERDEKLPPVAELCQELQVVRELGRKQGRWT